MESSPPFWKPLNTDLSDQVGNLKKQSSYCDQNTQGLTGKARPPNPAFVIFYKICFCLVRVRVLPAYGLCTMWVPGAHGGQKKAWGLLSLELQRVMSHHVGTRIGTQVLCKNSRCSALHCFLFEFTQWAVNSWLDLTGFSLAADADA